MKNLNLQALFAFSMTVLIWIALICALIAIFGCVWQGQKHTEYWAQSKDIVYPADMPLCFKPEAWVKVVQSKWWSMRCLWRSNGIECFTKTPYYTSGANIKESRSDPNSIEAAGTAGGNIISETVKGVVK